MGNRQKKVLGLSAQPHDFIGELGLIRTGGLRISSPPRGQTMASAKAMADFALAHVGEPYDLSAIVGLHFRDDDDEGTEPNTLADDGEWICSRLADMGLRDTETLHRVPLPAAFTVVHLTWRPPQRPARRSNLGAHQRPSPA